MVMFDDELEHRTVAELIRSLYAIVDEFERRNRGRRFTPDGHLVGSIGEIIAAEWYGLTLYPANAETHDAKSPCGREVQIKVTQNETGQVGLRSEPEHLLVLYLARNGSVSELFNGPGALVWNAAGRMQKNGQRPISARKLRILVAGVSTTERINPVERAYPLKVTDEHFVESATATE
ncbi:TPA: hypothetical protein MNH60_005367 [Citrobacter farmeri]|nr:hypothetical protein [Citrobacter farmeri]HCA0089686.1 hypothetical protein [Citrobacter farmeri]HCA0349007.1 hypothetical protein [Citrobacter farmeri]HCA0595024.1 hypothetical protein [Citrobacter farmeri]